jgi:hypothetical protein
MSRLDSPAWRWRVAWGATAAAVWLLFWPFAPDKDGRGIEGTDKMAHVVVFGGLAWAWGRVLETECRGNAARLRRRRWALAAGLALATVAVELAQPLAGRSRDPVDAAAGCAGIAAATLLGGAPAAGVAAAVAACGLSFMARGLVDYAREWKAFPVLAAADAPWWAESWSTNGVAVSAVPEGLRVEMVPDYPFDWPGVFRVPAARDWSKCGDWRLRVYWGGGGAGELTVRLDDDRKDNAGYNDRFQREWRVEPGWNEIAIPRGEWERTSGGGALDVRHVARWGIFLAERPDFVYWIVGRAELDQPKAEK